MLNLTSLLCSLDQPADALRYGRGHGSPRTAAERRPVVVWNITRRCNLRCIHCYAHAKEEAEAGELSFEQGRALIDDLAGFGDRKSVV